MNFTWATTSLLPALLTLPFRGPGSKSAEIYSKKPVFGLVGVENRPKPAEPAILA